MKKRVLSAMPSQTFEEGALDEAQQTGKLSYDGYYSGSVVKTKI